MPRRGDLAVSAGQGAEVRFSERHFGTVSVRVDHEAGSCVLSGSWPRARLRFPQFHSLEEIDLALGQLASRVTGDAWAANVTAALRWAGQELQAGGGRAHG